MWNQRLEAHAAAMLRRSEQSHETKRRRQQQRVSPATLKAFGEFREQRIATAKASGVFYPKACPHCHNAEVLRAGFKRGIQRYRCRGCNRTFGDPATGGSPIFGRRWKLMCYRCGSFHTQNAGPGAAGGRAGNCLDCHRSFVQGGREEIERGHLLLKLRIELLQLSGEIAAELLQQATLDVLDGRGYCWTVELDVGKARRGAHGESWFGSDHPAYQLTANGTCQPSETS
jgi:transposase-like protein